MDKTSVIEGLEINKGDVFVVVGSFTKCGKTALAKAVAAHASTIGSTHLVSMDDAIQSTPLNIYFEALAAQAPPDYSVGATPQDADITVYDHYIDTPNAKVLIIAPPLLEVPELGLVDEAGRAHRSDIVNAVLDNGQTPLPVIDTNIIALLTERHRLLRDSDWRVLRELERMYLRNTPLGTAREFVRESVDINACWGIAQKF